MGEYKFSVNSSLSSIEYQSSVNTSGLPSSSSSQSYFADDGPQQLQDVAVKQQISPSPVNGDHQQLPSTKGTVKEDSVLAVLGGGGGDKSSGGPQMQLPSSYNNEASLNVINSSTNSSTSSLWSASVDDTLIHGLNASAAANNAVSCALKNTMILYYVELTALSCIFTCQKSRHYYVLTYLFNLTFIFLLVFLIKQ